MSDEPDEHELHPIWHQNNERILTLQRRRSQLPGLRPLDFIPALTQHIPDPRRHLVRYFGWYTDKSCGMRAKTTGDAPRDDLAEPSPSASRARRRWAVLIKRIGPFDPLQCPRCRATMNIVSFIEPTQPVWPAN